MIYAWLCSYIKNLNVFVTETNLLDDESQFSKNIHNFHNTIKE